MESASHLQRMSCHCAALAERMGLDGELIGPASRLHDVGMSDVADKAAPLTTSEREALERHPETGHVLLGGTGLECFDLAAEIALTHHERFDGGGYPCGLRGETIPLAGRITAAADAFDALTTDRPYRPAVSVEAAAETLLAERGHQFDPDVVDMFLGMLDDVAQTLAHIPDEHPIHALDEQFLSLQAAAAQLAISPSRLRRLSDDGRISTLRTSGGHRRFPSEEVQRLARELGVRPHVTPVEPPHTPIPLLARCLEGSGQQLAEIAAKSIYRHTAPGWFSSRAAITPLEGWVHAISEGAATGRYAGVLAASDALMRHAQGHAASLLERHLFVERFSHAALRAMISKHAEIVELNGTRRLFVSIQQRLLD